MQEGLMDYLQLPPDHPLLHQFRRTVVFSDQCTEFQKVADEEVVPPPFEQQQFRRTVRFSDQCTEFQKVADEETERSPSEVPPLATHRPHNHPVYAHRPSSLSARNGMYLLANEAHFTGQKRNLSPTHREREALMNKRLPQLETAESDTEMETDTANIQTGALGSSEASELQ